MMKSLVNTQSHYGYGNLVQLKKSNANQNKKAIKHESPLMEHFFITFLSTLSQDEIDYLVTIMRKNKENKIIKPDQYSEELLTNIESFKWNLNNWKLLFSNSNSED